MNKKNNTDDTILKIVLPCDITVVTPPSLYLPTEGLKIFLAGSVGGGDDSEWQSTAIDLIRMSSDEGHPLTIYNPRRLSGEFLPENEVEQAAWTISMLAAADYIILHLSGDSGSPISTFELGVFIKDLRLYLSIDDSYSRKEVIEIHYNYFGIGQIYKNLKESIMAIQSNIRQISHK